MKRLRGIQSRAEERTGQHPAIYSPVGVNLENAPVLLVFQYGLLGPDMACLLGVYGLSW